MFCNECGHENGEISKFCSECGKGLTTVKDNNKNEELPIKKKSKKRLIISLILSLVVIVGGVIAFLYYKKTQEEKRVQEYVGEMAVNAFNMYTETISNAMVISSYSEQWDDAIDDGRDFNVALANLKNTYEEKGLLQDLVDGQTEIQESMKYLQDVPEGYEDAYDVLKEMYTVYVEFSNQAQSPTGSLLTFNNKTNDLFSEFNTLFEEFLITMPADVKEEYETYVEKYENEEDADI